MPEDLTKKKCNECKSFRRCRGKIAKGSAICEKRLGLRGKIQSKKHTESFWNSMLGIHRGKR